ncbi:MAG: globin [Acidimicrobiales bacterium]
MSEGPQNVGREGGADASPTAPVETIFDLLGGRSFFDELVERFYAAVAADPVLRPLYPEDLAPAKGRLAGFLVQYWGGPDDYSQERGHPRLRLRHLPFRIGVEERDAWFSHMSAAVRSMALHPVVEEVFLDYFSRAATAMINSPASPPLDQGNA